LRVMRLLVSLGNMAPMAWRAGLATCQEMSCGHAASVNVDNLPDDFAVPDVSLSLRCSVTPLRSVPKFRDFPAREI
jgi:hypothetical protein